MNDAAPTRAGGVPPHPRISWFTAACVLVSNIIGGGIFTTTGFIARDLGDPSLLLLLWIIGALIAVGGAMCYSELGAALPRVGGDYVYLRHSYGPLAGFLSGWTSFTVGFGAGIAAASVSFASYALQVVPLAEDNSPASKGLALLLLWTLTATHAAGTGAGGSLQRLLTTTKIAAVLALIIGGLAVGSGSWGHLTVRAPDATPSAGRAIVALIFVLYTYFGWNVVGYIAGEIADPQRNIPKIAIGGTAFVALLYLLLNLVYLYALPVTELALPPILPVAEKAASALWGPESATFVAGLLCISIAGGVSSMVWAGPRVYWAMAADGVFASFLKTLDARTGVPLRAILLQSVWASFLILTGTFEQLVIFSGFSLAAFNALTIGALFVLRRRQPALPRPFQVPFYPFLPALIIAALLIIVGYSLAERPIESLFGVATILAGIPFYWMWRNSPATQ